MRNESVLEKFHAGLCLHVLELTGVVAHLAPARQQWIHHVVTQSIGLTDMSLHFHLLNRLDEQPARLVNKGRARAWWGRMQEHGKSMCKSSLDLLKANAC